MMLDRITGLRVHETDSEVLIGGYTAGTAHDAMVASVRMYYSGRSQTYKVDVSSIQCDDAAVFDSAPDAFAFFNSAVAVIKLNEAHFEPSEEGE